MTNIRLHIREDLHAILEEEAKLLGTNIQVLAKNLLEVIARDNLIGAILDDDPILVPNNNGSATNKLWWTEERREELVRLFHAGTTDKDIAAIMNTTRPAIIGQRDRLGLRRYRHGNAT